MIKHFHKRMTLLYTFSTGIILTLVLASALYISNRDFEKNTRDAFSNNILNIITTLQASRLVSNSWLSSLEAENNMIIHIEDNNVPLLFDGSWKPQTPRSELIQKTREAAADMGVSTARGLVSSTVVKTDIFHIYGDHNDAYLASVLVFATEKGHQSLILLKEIVRQDSSVYRQRSFYLFLDVAGIAALFGISWIFVGRSLRPLNENRKKQTEFIAAASHELRSPLSVIRSSASAVAVSPDKQEQLLSNIDRECERMGHLISDLLVLASADSKQWTLHMENVDMDTLLINTYEVFEPLAMAKHVRLHLDLPDHALPRIYGDRLRLEQIMTILLDNAISYTPSGKEIFIRAETKRNALLLMVEDEGKGIPDSEKKAVFERFYRSDQSRNDKKHFGLGLSVAKELTELHKGKIKAADGKHGGACFIVELPLPAAERNR